MALSALSACGESDKTSSTPAPATGTSSTASATTTAAPEAQVISSIVHQNVEGPWLQWDEDSCSFKEAPDGGTEYTTQLRSDSAVSSLGFTPETTTLPFDLIMNKSVEEAADAASIKLTTQSTEFPSKTVPLRVADAMTQVKPDAIISGLIVGDLYPAVQAKYDKACIPFIDQFAMPTPTPVPMFQTSYKVDGKTMGEAAVKTVKDRGWPVEDTWVIMCTDSQLSKEPGSIYDIGTSFTETVASGLGIPKEHVPPFIECPGETGPLASRTAVRNWLTAHPEAKYVVGAAWDDGRAPGMVQALEDAGFKDNAAIFGRAATEDALKIMASGSPIFAGDLNMNFAEWGPAMVAMAQDIVEGKPVPTLTSPTVSMIVGADAAKQALADIYGK